MARSDLDGGLVPPTRGGAWETTAATASAEWLAAENEDLTALLRHALATAEDFAEEPELATPAAANGPATCPPHHWLIGDGAAAEFLRWTCVRCGELRDTPRQTDTRAWVDRRRAQAPPPPGGDPD